MATTIVATGFDDGAIRFRIEQNPRHLPLRALRFAAVMKAGQVPRRSAPCPSAASRSGWSLSIQRLWCAPAARPARPRSASPTNGRGYTHAFERYALELCRHMTIQDVARHLGVSWDTVKDIQKRTSAAAFQASPGSSISSTWPSTRSASAGGTVI